MAGPDIVQQVPLYLHYFPGDGEAVLRLVIACDERLRLTGAESAVGRAQVADGRLEVDYGRRPLSGDERVDTLRVQLIGRSLGVGDCEGQLFSSAGRPDVPEHVALMALSVAAPVPLEWSLRPAEIFPGTAARLTAVLRHAGTAADGPLRRVEWAWPPAIELLAGDAASVWTQGLAVGGSDTLQWTVRVAAADGQALVLGGRVDTDHVAGSPLPPLPLGIAPVPVARLVAPLAAAGGRGSLSYEWRNPSAVALDFDELAIEVPTAFAAVEARSDGHRVEVAEPSADRPGRIRVGGGRLAPGGILRLEIEADMLRPGPFPWKSVYRAQGHDEEVPLPGETTLRVVWPQPATATAAREAGADTDLELVSAAFGRRLAVVLKGLEAPRRTPIYIEPLEKGDKNWAVDDVLTQGLIDRGYRVTLKDDGPEVALLRYRLAEARVVYRKRKSLWNPFGGRLQREAFGDLFLDLERGGRIEWTARVKAYASDASGNDLDLLEESAVVKRTVVKEDSKLIERGLTLGIVSGLFFIFFAP